MMTAGVETDKKDPKKTLILGSIYFAFNLVYSLYHFKAKFIMDGYSHVFEIANWERFGSVLGRHVIYLHQALPVLIANLGATTTTIMKTYVVSDTLLYYGCFLVCLFLVKDIISAVLVIAVHLFGMAYNYFMMVGELMPGAMFVVTTISIILKWKQLSSMVRVMIVPSAFFVASSHPLALVSFLSFVVCFGWFDLRLKEGMGRWGLVSVIVFVAALKTLFIDEYDVGTVSTTTRTLHEALKFLLTPDYLMDYVAFVFFSSPVVSILFLVLAVRLFRSGKTTQLMLLFLFIGFWSLLVQRYLDFSGFSITECPSMMHDRYLFPIRFIVLSGLLITSVDYKPLLKAPMIALLTFLGVIGFSSFERAQLKATRTINMLQHTVNECRTQGLIRGYYSIEDYCEKVYVHRNSFYVTLVLSNIDGGQPCHVVHADAELIKEINDLTEYELLLMPEVYTDSRSLNSKRFVIQNSSYRLMSHNCDF